MVMHSDEAWRHCIAREIDRLCITRYGRTRGRTDGRYFPSADNYSLVLGGRRTRSVDHSDMCESHHRRLDADKLLKLVALPQHKASKQSHKDV